MLTTDLDGEDEKDKGALDNLLAQLIAELGMDKKVRWRGMLLGEQGSAGKGGVAGLRFSSLQELPLGSSFIPGPGTQVAPRGRGLSVL
jgi:hypothetical protein